jgi:hypothetical protein
VPACPPMRTEKVYACDFGDPESVRVRGGVKEAAKAIVRARESFWRGARVIERGWAGLCLLQGIGYRGLCDDLAEMLFCYPIGDSWL